MTRPTTVLEFAKATLVALLLAVATALVFHVTLEISRPGTDERSSWLSALWMAAIVLLVGSPFIVIGALVAYFLWLMLLRERSLRRSAAVVFAVVSATILVTTPWLGESAVLASLLALVLGALLARALPWTEYR